VSFQPTAEHQHVDVDRDGDDEGNAASAWSKLFEWFAIAPPLAVG